MAKGPRICLLTSAGGPPAWLRVWLAIAAVVVGAILLWFGLVLALALVFTIAVALIPVWVWRLYTAPRPPAAPATIEGEYSVTPTSPENDGGTARGRQPADEAGRPGSHP